MNQISSSSSTSSTTTTTTTTSKMAVYKNYYNRRPLSLTLTVYCLFLLCSTGYSSTEHHRHNKLDDSQVERGRIGEKTSSSKNPAVISCPHCDYINTQKTHKTEPDNIRLEAIRRQILSKLGMRDKPNITYSLPREVIMETLFRAEESSGFLDNYQTEDDGDVSNSNSGAKNQQGNKFETVDVDDFYGRTSEIISFAEDGETINGNKVLEFRISTESGQTGQELRVRAATLWLRADIEEDNTSKRYPPMMTQPLDCQTTLWVFNVKHTILNGTLSAKAYSASQTIDTSVSNWQKFDLTSTVRDWYVDSSSTKLRLLVDCSGCCRNLNIHHFNSHRDRRSDPNRPFLVIHTDPNFAKRVRRRALDCAQDSGNQCCKQRFYVSFKQLGWEDWVIAPHGYYANYCRGDCGHHRTPDTFVTYHTHVIEEMRKTHHLSGMQPCCAPLKFSSMSLIYFGPDSNIIKRDLPKMVVDECGCP